MTSSSSIEAFRFAPLRCNAWFHIVPTFARGFAQGRVKFEKELPKALVNGGGEGKRRRNNVGDLERVV